MSTPSTDGLKQELDAGRMKVGNNPVDANGFALTGTNVSTVPYIDSAGTWQVAPIALPLMAGVISTSNSVLSIQGASTLTANDIMHQTLVAGAGVTTFTSTGFLRVTVTDSAGNITSGQHYIQIGTLS